MSGLDPGTGDRSLVECIACRSRIPQTATKCSVCSADQRPWVNRLQVLGAVAAGITLIASGLTYVWTTAKSAVDQSQIPRIEVVAFSTTGIQTFANFGASGAYLSVVKVSGKVPFRDEQPDAVAVYRDSRIIPINTPIGAGEFVNLRAPVSVSDNPLSLALDADAARWKERLQDTRNAEACLAVTYLAIQDATYLLWSREFGGALRTFKASATLVFSAGRAGGWHEKSFPVTGVFLRKDISQCNEWLGAPSPAAREALQQ